MDTNTSPFSTAVDQENSKLTTDERIPRFIDLAPALVANGYAPITIRAGTKRPVGKKWQTPRDPKTVPTPVAERAFTGLLTVLNPAIDLDVRDAPTVATLIDLADESFGVAPIRVGQPPKALLVYRTDEPFPKLASSAFALAGEDFTRSDYAPSRIEVLADGQMFVGYAKHPDTGRAYTWSRGEPLVIARADLPFITEGTARHFIATAERFLIELGATRLERTHYGWDRDDRTPEDRARRGSWAAGSKRGGKGSGNGDYWWCSVPIETLIDIFSLYRRGRGWHGICECCGDESAGGSFNVATGDDGGLVFICYAGCHPDRVAEAVAIVLDDRLEAVR